MRITEVIGAILHRNRIIADMNRYSPKRAFYIDAYREGVAKSILEILCGEHYKTIEVENGLCRPPDYNKETQECPSLNNFKKP